MNMAQSTEAPAALDYIGGGGDVASILLRNQMDPQSLRPFIHDNRTYMTVNRGGKEQTIVTNAPGLLRVDDWRLLDRTVRTAAQQQLKAWNMLRAANSFTIPNGLGKTVLEHEMQSDIGPATVSMDGLRKGSSDRPQYDIGNLPLPLFHKDFSFSARQLAVSRNGSPLDVTNADLAARKVAEEVEKMTLGTETYSFGGANIYGYTNYPKRLTATLTDPTDSGWDGATLVREVLAMKAQSRAARHYGPWDCLVSPDWDEHLDDDYSESKGDNTVRDRIGKIEGISRPTTVDFLTGYQIILVQRSANVARGVVGMDITTLQWPSQGGMEINFKVMGILVPQLRCDFNDRTGVVHGSV